MKLLVFILALVVGAGSLMMVKQFTPATQPVTPTLVASVGMDYREVKRRSTLDLGDGAYDAGNRIDGDKYANRDRLFSDTTEFDWEVEGTGLRFAGCKFYWMKTGRNDDPHLVEIKVTTAQRKLTYAELKAEMLSIQERILADGWKPVIYNNGKSALEVLDAMLEQPKFEVSTTGIGGVTYGKGDVALTFLARKLRPIEQGEDVKRANDLIHWIELQTRAQWEADNALINLRLPQ